MPKRGACAMMCKWHWPGASHALANVVQKRTADSAGCWVVPGPGVCGTPCSFSVGCMVVTIERIAAVVRCAQRRHPDLNRGMEVGGGQRRVIPGTCSGARAAGAVAVTLHDLNHAALCATRVALLAHGAVVASGPPEAVLTPDCQAQVYGVAVVVMCHPVYGTLLVAPVFDPHHDSSAAEATELPQDTTFGILHTHRTPLSDAREHDAESNHDS